MDGENDYVDRHRQYRLMEYGCAKGIEHAQEREDVKVQVGKYNQVHPHKEGMHYCN